MSELLIIEKIFIHYTMIALYTEQKKNVKKLKPGFYYPSWRPELTVRVDGWPVSITRQHGPLTRAVNSGSGNRALSKQSDYDNELLVKQFSMSNRVGFRSFQTDRHKYRGQSTFWKVFFCFWEFSLKLYNYIVTEVNWNWTEMLK